MKVNGRVSAMFVLCAACSFETFGNNSSEGMLGETATESDGGSTSAVTSGPTSGPTSGTLSTTNNATLTTSNPTTSPTTNPTSTTPPTETEGPTETTGNPSLWAFERTLQIDGFGLELEDDVENVPILISLDGDRLDFSAAQDGGGDLRFVAESGAILPFEVESWDAQAERAVLWVRVDTVAADDVTSIRMRYGNDDAPNGEDAQAVWSNDYVFVHHFDGDCDDGFADSTANGLDASCVNLGNNVLGAGPLGPLLSLDASGTLAIFDDPALNLAEQFSISAWTDVQMGTLNGSEGREVLSKRNHFRMEVERAGGGDGPRASVWTPMAEHVQGSTSLSLGVHVLAMSAAAGDIAALFVDGDLIDDDALVAISPAIGEDLFIGPDMIGRLDEVRVSSVARNADWFVLQNASLRDLAVAYGPQVEL